MNTPEKIAESNAGLRALDIVKNRLAVEHAQRDLRPAIQELAQVERDGGSSFAARGRARRHMKEAEDVLEKAKRALAAARWDQS